MRKLQKCNCEERRHQYVEEPKWAVISSRAIDFGNCVPAFHLFFDSLLCECDEFCPDHHFNNYTCFTAKGYCFAKLHFDEINKTVVRTHGCTADTHDGGIFQCRHKKHEKPTEMMCCKDGDYCNSRLQPPKPFTPAKLPNAITVNQPPSKYHTPHGIALVISITVCVMLLIILVTYLYFRHRQNHMKRRYDTERQIIIQHGTRPVGSLRELLDESEATGTGSGVPLLIQRTIARQITFQTCIGKGRFGEVWKGRWRGEEVAVKIFAPSEEAFWYREAEFYQTVLLRHDHVLGFIAADTRTIGTESKLLLITEYHKYGSLYDFLQNFTYDYRILLRLAYTTVSGLSYLHREIYGMKGKPAIAHRDIKSRNILVKSNFTCALGDLGLAVRLNPETKELDIGKSTRQPTVRYAAPEILESTMDETHFDAYRVADMYSFGLVLWEMARRCQTQDTVDQYKPPFFEWASDNPTFEEMKKIVIVDRQRPEVPERWATDQHLRLATKLMCECWSHSPAARLTAARVKKTLQAFVADEESESSYS
eukprot:gene16621-18311_t